jgi:acyl-CoA thioesterase
MLFSEVLGSVTFRDGQWSGTVPDDWMQGRSVFGGLQTALAVRAMRALVPADFPLRVAQTTFVGPVEGGTVQGSASVLRTGKGTIHAEARILMGDQTTTLVTGVFGRGRASKVAVVARAPDFVPAQNPIEFTYVPGLLPKFTQHFTMRWMAGTPPYSGTTEPPRAVIDVTMHEPTPAREDHLFAIADAIPPLALSMLTEPAPGSSVTWTLEVVDEQLEGLPLAGWRLHADVRAGHSGYTSQYAVVCAPGGKVAALSTQTMMIFG